MALKELGENGVAEAYRLLAKNFKEAAKVDIGNRTNKLDDDVTLSPTMAGELILNPEVSIDSARATGKRATPNEGSGDMPATLHGEYKRREVFMTDDSGGATYDAMLFDGSESSYVTLPSFTFPRGGSVCHRASPFAFIL